MDRSKTARLLTIIGPGILVAATGVGAGDLATGAFAGSKLGVAVLWAVLVGAAMKFLVTEGLARWQLATGETLLEGAVHRFGRAVMLLFLAYLLLWSFFVGSTLMSACGVAAHALVPRFQPVAVFEAGSPYADWLSAKAVLGLLHSLAAVIMVRLGGYRLFEKVMGVCIAVMFVTVILTAATVRPPGGEVLRGLFVPRIPDLHGMGVEWTVALIGGVGGTLTVLCYGYWIREEGRHGPDDLPVCRIDLATGYLMTAMFGAAMVIIGSRIEVEGDGTQLVVQLGDQLRSAFGTWGLWLRWAFLIGAWGAVFSSLLGVWQSVPYLFADFYAMMQTGDRSTPSQAVDTASPSYRFYLYGLAVIPAAGLWSSFEQVQKVYAVFGALFVPLLALALLILNGRADWVGSRFRNSPVVTGLLIVVLLFFAAAGVLKLWN